MGSIAQTTPRELDASQVKITRTSSLREVPVPGSPGEFSNSHCTDHMVTARWTAAEGWETPEIKPFQNLSLPPTAPCLHYATECFEGMKVYRGYDGRLRLFRPDRNGERLLLSSLRVSLPGFGPEQIKLLIAKLMQIDGPRWLPKSQPGRFLYIRPTLIGSGAHLGVQTPKEALLFIIALPWPDTSRQIMASAAGGLKLLTSQPDTVRAWPGGFGYAKLGANYGPSLAAHGVAQTHGFDQVLWLFGADRRQVTEAGASNIFVVWQKKKATTTQTQDGDKNDGSAPQLELVTPALDDQLILPGITRQSVLDLARQRLVHGVADLQPVDVVERSFTIDELEQAWREGRIIEAFVSGTAFFITPIKSIRHGETDMDMLAAENPHAAYAMQIKTWLEAIKYGKVEHEWAYPIDDEIEAL